MADERADVVIAGAGPNGLLLACELALAGVRPVVLDVLPGPSPEPKANGLVGQIIRALDMRGLYRTFTGDEDPPRPAYQGRFAAMTLNFLGVPDNPMYMLPIQQPRLVRLLEKRARDLGVDLRWGHGLSDIRPSTESVGLSVSSPERDYSIDAGFLVGADGGRSLVRKAAGIDFPGSTAPTVSRLAHVHVPGELRRTDGGVDIPGHGTLPFGHTRLDRGGLIFAEFEPGRSLLGTIEFSPPVDEVPMTLTELRESAHRILGVEFPFEEPKDEGPHALRRINGQNTRIAERYRDGRVLLLGDAAHVHSPMGGPGLNLGLQDTINLGWKLAAEINGTAPAGLLDTYQSERYPVGLRVMMHSLAQTALMVSGPEVTALRTLLGELFTSPDVQQRMAGLLAGADVRYDVGDDHRLSGRLVPDLTLDDGRRVAELLHEGRPVLLDLDGGVAAAVRGWEDRVDTVGATIGDGLAVAMLIRPDGYVAWAADTFDPAAEAALRAALERWFGPSRAA
ncbi:2-polyprenyl-6-methoxyphenol hydroxylase and related FAD-dependent oxidoreductases [Mycobacterium rhizamassiliense]|jgi:2-polyprenyl-6-methoxyphenol hydroxylase-like FAD-dependent oxidoreductase|uniref:2-polyprenyl-6-methoxyphenol hydroxylase and related FAD-dependent oxidoreductases n=1 Tax=Mycobacterium rhizamassiliense TaxID=1841860 RepID=A0A2U3NXC7_9MYCO|nr:FAD-dependent monooxygenase [Mycobacterium rhizamassiliense]SPM36123.1 2-polyprenyl-6-methoxyphenol hydroxylase and related FAD-dependent oxidoreductases [Mycobacterium rhizamassiliense]